jgi:peptide/nickel transport system substrate-binding protein
LLSGRADLTVDVTPETGREIAGQPGLSVVSAQSSVCTIFMCNMQNGVCTDRRVRQALNYGLNVPELIDAVMEGAATPLNGPLTSVHLGCDPATQPYPYDPERARELLEEAGWGEGMRLVLDVPSVLPDEAPRIARRMVQQYAGVGITAEVREFSDRPGYAEMVRAKKIDDACCFDSSPLSTYRVLREKFHSRLRGPWWQGYANPEVDRLIEQAQATVDVEQRRGIYHQAYRLIREDAPWIFLYAPTISWGVGKRAQGWSATSDGLVRFA